MIINNNNKNIKNRVNNKNKKMHVTTSIYFYSSKFTFDK